MRETLWTIPWLQQTWNYEQSMHFLVLCVSGNIFSTFIITLPDGRDESLTLKFGAKTLLFAFTEAAVWCDDCVYLLINGLNTQDFNIFQNKHILLPF